jgi:hypothetical protein
MKRIIEVVSTQELRSGVIPKRRRSIPIFGKELSSINQL